MSPIEQSGAQAQSQESANAQAGMDFHSLRGHFG